MKKAVVEYGCYTSRRGARSAQCDLPERRMKETEDLSKGVQIREEKRVRGKLIRTSIVPKVTKEEAKMALRASQESLTIAGAKDLIPKNIKSMRSAIEKTIALVRIRLDLKEQYTVTLRNLIEVSGCLRKNAEYVYQVSRWARRVFMRNFMVQGSPKTRTVKEKKVGRDGEYERDKQGNIIIVKKKVEYTPRAVMLLDKVVKAFELIRDRSLTLDADHPTTSFTDKRQHRKAIETARRERIKTWFATLDTLPDEMNDQLITTTCKPAADVNDDTEEENKEEAEEASEEDSEEEESDDDSREVRQQDRDQRHVVKPFSGQYIVVETVLMGKKMTRGNQKNMLSYFRELQKRGVDPMTLCKIDTWLYTNGKGQMLGFKDLPDLCDLFDAYHNGGLALELREHMTERVIGIAILGKKKGTLGNDSHTELEIDFVCSLRPEEFKNMSVVATAEATYRALRDYPNLETLHISLIDYKRQVEDPRGDHLKELRSKIMEKYGEGIKTGIKHFDANFRVYVEEKGNDMDSICVKLDRDAQTARLLRDKSC